MKKKYHNTTLDELYRTPNCTIGILDQDNFYTADIIIPKKGDSEGQEVVKNMRYFGSITKAIKDFCTTRAKRAKNKDLHDFLKHYLEAVDEIKQAIGGV